MAYNKNTIKLVNLVELKGLGLKSSLCLNKIGIFTRADLEQIGPVKAYIKLQKEPNINPSLNFLYAMVGALADVHWVTIAKTEKSRLLLELEGYKELAAVLGIES